MNKEPITIIFQILFVVAFIVAKPIIKAIMQSKKNRASISPPKPEKPKKDFADFASYTENKTTATKNVDDVLSEIFGNDLAKANVEKKPTRETTFVMRSSVKPEASELPEFKPTIKEFKVSEPKLPDDIKEFEPHIITPIRDRQEIPPVLKKLRNLSCDDLRYGIIFSEVLGPPVSLKD